MIKPQAVLKEKKEDRIGTVQGHRDGFGFVIPDDGQLDIFLSEREMTRVMHGDRVLVRVLGTDRRGRPEGQITEVLERATRHVIGKWSAVKSSITQIVIVKRSVEWLKS